MAFGTGFDNNGEEQLKDQLQWISKQVQNPTLSTLALIIHITQKCQVTHYVMWVTLSRYFRGVCVFIVSVSEGKLCLGRAGPSLQDGSGLCLMIVGNAAFLNSIWG